ncbi:MAG: tetratricopeptide repeat protein [Bradymonadaceae bacterium]
MSDDETAPVDVDWVVDELDGGRELADVIDVSEGAIGRLERAAGQLFDEGRYQEAITILRGVTALDRGRYYPQLLIGKYEVARGSEERGIEALITAKELGPDDAPELTFELGRAPLSAGETEAGIAQLEETVERAGSDDPEGYGSRAEELLSELT